MKFDFCMLVVFIFESTYHNKLFLNRNPHKMPKKAAVTKKEGKRAVDSDE